MTNKSKKKSTTSFHPPTIYDYQAEICSALANATRLEILDLLSQGEMTSTALLEQLNIPKANLSQHLAVLKGAGIIKSRKEGLFQYESLALPKIKDACALVRSVLIEKMAQDEKHNSLIIKELKSQR